MSPQRCICNKCQCEFFRNLKQYSLLKINDFPVYLKKNSISDTDLSALFFFLSELRFQRKYVALIFDLSKEGSKCTFLQKFK